MGPTSKQSKMDPVEAAKRQQDGKPLEPLPEPAVPTPAPVAAKPAVPETPPAPPAPKGPRKRWRLVADGLASFNGHPQHMKVGKVFDPQHYGGEAGIERLKKAGLKLEPFEE